LYGAVIFGDMTQDKIYAYKKGDATATVIGTVEARSNRQHRNGVVHIAQNRWGELYAVFLNFNADQQIYKLKYKSNPEYLGRAKVVGVDSYHPQAELKASGEYQMTVHNVKGGLVLKTQGMNDFHKDLNSLGKSGLYFVKVTSASGTFTRRILVK